MDIGQTSPQLREQEFVGQDLAGWAELLARLARLRAALRHQLQATANVRSSRSAICLSTSCSVSSKDTIER